MELPLQLSHSTQELSESFIEESSKDPSKIIQLFELACSKENHWHLDKQSAYSTLLDNITRFKLEGKINNSQINRVMKLITHIYPSVRDLTLKEANNFFLAKHITDENVYKILAEAKAAGNTEYVKKAIGYICAKTGIEISLGYNNATIAIRNLKVSFDELHKHIANISKIFNIAIDFSPIFRAPTPFREIEPFLKVYGANIYALNLSKFISDIDTLILAENCPNLKRLSLNSKDIQETDVKKLNHLKNLESLAIYAENLKKLPDLSHLTNLNYLVIHGPNLESFSDISALNKLTEINISCLKLTELPDFSPLSNLKILNLDGCKKLTDEKRLMALSGLLKHDIRNALKILKRLKIKNITELQNLLTPKLEEILNNPETKLEDRLFLVDYVIANEILELHDEHPLLQTALLIQAAHSLPGQKNPGSVYKKALELSKQPCDFKPPTLQVEGVNVAFDWQQLKKLAESSTVPREVLPKKATLRAFDQLTEALLSKFEKHPSETADLLKRLGFAKEHVTISIPYLQNLLNIESGVVSEAESKWKAVVNALLDENKELTKEGVFTNQEIALITVLCGIGNCGPKKNEGIATAYELIDAQYKYKIAVPEWISVEDRKKSNELSDSIDFVKKFAEKHPDNTLEAIIKSVNRGEALAMSAMQLLPETEESGFWEWDKHGIKMDESGLFPLISQKGATALLNLPQALGALTLEFKSFMKKQFQNNEILKDLLSHPQSIGQSVHQWLYIENLIGRFVGTSDRILYDHHTGVLDDGLLAKSREEILEVFFKHATPQALVDELTHNLNRGPDDIKEALKLILPEDQFWTDKATLNKAGTLKLLTLFGFLSAD